MERPFSLFPQRPGAHKKSWVTRLGASTVGSWRFHSRLWATLGRALVAYFEPGEAAAAVARRVMVRQVFFTGFEALPAK